MSLKIFMVSIMTFVVMGITGCGSSNNDVPDSGKEISAPPVADAGRDKPVNVGDVVVLDGTKSYDPGKNNLTYTWKINTKPPGSTAKLSDENSARPKFVADKKGAYKIELVVNNGKLDSKSDNVVITASGTSGGNSEPFADAGRDQSTKTDNVVYLDGSASRDNDGDTITYKWTFVLKPIESTATLIASTSVHPRFIPDVDGRYKVKLIVNDGKNDSLADEVSIIVTAASVNAAPVANAGADQDVKENDFVVLDGTGSSDADGDPLTYTWSDVSTGNPALSDLDIATPRLTASSVGIFVYQLIVNDGTEDSIADYVTITVTPKDVNVAPVANAGSDQNVESGKAVILDGSASSDADGDTLTYKWEFVSVPGAVLPPFDDDTKVFPRFTPDIEGDYVVKLIVTDSNGAASQPDYTQIKADDTTTNQKPVADIQYTIASDNYVYLDGSGSSDPDGDAITYDWNVTYDPVNNSTSVDGNGSLVRFKAVSSGGYGVTLLVDDGSVKSDPAVVVIDVP